MTRDVPGASSARGVAPNVVRDCERSRVPFGSDGMELDWGERGFSWASRAGTPAKRAMSERVAS